MVRSSRWDIAYLYFMFVGGCLVVGFEVAGLLDLTRGPQLGLVGTLCLVGLGAAVYSHRKTRLAEFAYQKSMLRLRRYEISARAAHRSRLPPDEGSH